MSLLPAPFAPDLFQAPGIRISPVNGDNMEPTLRGGWDYVVCAPASTYTGEGLYLVDAGGYGIPQVYRCEASLARSSSWDIRLTSDNKHYPDQFLSREQFAGIVLAKVVADVKVRDERSLRQIAGAAE